MDNQAKTPIQIKPPLLSKATIKRIHLRGVLRLWAYCFVVSVGVGTAAIGSAYGDFKESAVGVGRQLANMKDLTGATHRVRLNGETMYVSSAMTDQTMDQVLDRYEGLCKEHSGGLAEEFAKLPEALKDSVAPGNSSAGMGVVRKQSSRDGMVACLAQRPEDSFATLGTRMQDAMVSGDLSKIGNLRYVYTEKSENQTHVVTVWTDGPFRYTNIIPMDGNELPGSDPSNAPRPEKAYRLLTAEIEGAPYSIRLYDVDMDRQAILSTYEQKMPTLGWTQIEKVKQEDPTQRVFTNDDGVLMFVQAHEQNGKTYVTMTESRP